MQTIGERIRQLLALLRWDQVKLAKLTGHGQSTVSRVVSGARRPSVKIVRDIAMRPAPMAVPEPLTEAELAAADELMASVTATPAKPAAALEERAWGKTAHTWRVALGTRRHPGVEVTVRAQDQPDATPSKVKVVQVLQDLAEAVKRGDLDRAFE